MSLILTVKPGEAIYVGDQHLEILTVVACTFAKIGMYSVYRGQNILKRWVSDGHKSTKV
jgi:hypothetical protein